MGFQPPKGTRDLLPEEAAKLQKVLDIVRSVFESYGFGPLLTPAFEDFGLLSAKGGLGEAVKDEIYYFKDKSDRELGLRFDLTMPLVRVVAANPQLPKPFKRYAIGCVWRYDNPQAMRYREFWQADVDTVGSGSVLADAECLAAACECLERLGFKDFFVRVNNRKIVQAVFEKSLGVKDVRAAFRAVDKMEKIGGEAVMRELEKEAATAPDVAEKIMRFLKISGKAGSIIQRLRKEYGEIDGLMELEQLLRFAKDFGIEKRLKIDLSLVRGLDYYSGPVFEVSLGGDGSGGNVRAKAGSSVSKRVSCGGGGRYDNLVKDVGGQSIAATGISLGISRIFETMKENKMFEGMPKTVKVFVANADEKLVGEAVKVAKRIKRVEGVACQIDLARRNLKKQLAYANSVGIDYVVIVGEKELKEGKYVLKDMRKNIEDRLRFGELTKKLKSKVGSKP